MRKLLKKLFRNFYMRCIEPEEFKFKDKEYGTIDIASRFEVLYCNSFFRIDSGKNLYDSISLLSFKITIDNEIDSFLDLLDVIDYAGKHKNSNYTNYYIKYVDKYTILFIKGNIEFFNNLCTNVTKNHITSYIRTYLFPKGIPLSVEERFENNFIYTLGTPVNKIDILFIEENSRDNVIGIAFLKSELPDSLKHLSCIEYGNRVIIIDEIKHLYQLYPEILNLKVPQKHYQLYSSIHTSITEPDPYDEIDEIIED